MIVKYLASVCIAASAYAGAQHCEPSEVTPGGDAVAVRFIAAPLPRVREAVADAMQATGVLLFRNTEQSMEGERADERVVALGLGPGDEAVRAELAPITQDGKAGTQVRVETLRRANKKGAPKHTWSETVLDQTACLVSMLSLDDPLHRPKSPAANGPEVSIADSTSLLVRSRHFFFNAEAQPNHLIPFETTKDLLIDGLIVIPTGSLVAAYMEQANDVKDFGRGAKGQLRFKYLVLPNGRQLPLRGIVDFRGMSVSKGVLIATAVLFGGSTAASVKGLGFAIPAGTLFHAEVDGPQQVRVSRPAQGAP
jgi:hypothetical protein